MVMDTNTDFDSFCKSSAARFIGYALGIGALEIVPEGWKMENGRISPYSFNSDLFNTDGSISNLAHAYTAAACELNPEVVFGLAYKGTPLAKAVAQTIGGNIDYAFNRKEVKDHGESDIIVGASLKGKKVLIVDDVMTTGTSYGQAVEIIRANGGIPIGCVIAFDRKEQGNEGVLSAVDEFELKYHIPVCAAGTIWDLITFFDILKDSGNIEAGEALEKILAYQKQYGM